MKQSDTKTRIERAALSLFVAQGVAATTTREIAAGAGITEGAIYRHFKSKDELVQSLFAENYLGLAKEMLRLTGDEIPFETKVDRLVSLFVRRFDEDREMFAFIILTQHNNLKHISKQDVTPVGVLRLLFEDAVRSGACRSEDPMLLVSTALGIVQQAASFVLYGHLAPPMSRHEEFLRASIKRAVLP